MPKYHPIFGHLIAVKQTKDNLPKDAVFHVVVRRIARQFPDHGVFYLTLWPFSKTIAVVSDPKLAAQVESASLNKPATICDTMEVINGGASLMSMHGPTWKEWRARFNPGFATGYMTGLAPAIADEVAVFCELLRQKAASGDMFLLEEYTLRLTFDVIGRVTFDGRLHYQTQSSPLADSLRRQILWSPFATSINPIKRYLSIRPLVQMYNSYRMNQYLDQEIDKCFDELVLLRRGTEKTRSSSRSVISLAMDQYLRDTPQPESVSRKAFKELARPQLRMFLFAGHDTTSSTLLYCYHLLAKHPEALQKMRDEHTKVLGPDSNSQNLIQLIATEPALLNQVPYTLAVIKEVLRMFPPAGSLREGRPDLVLRDDQGRAYPTEDCHIWTLVHIMQSDPVLFPDPYTFLPERWLVGAEDPLHPPKGAYRPFEAGPRNCIGQTLAHLELKVALVMTVRTFDIEPAYDELDALQGMKGLKTVDGNRVYQAALGGGGAHPADGFPVRVRLRKE
jgi:cytochrome P450